MFKALLLVCALVLCWNTAQGFNACSTNVLDDGCWPIQYTCDGNNPVPNPEVQWSSDVSNAASYFVLMHDPTGGGNYVHWVAKDIPAKTKAIARGSSGTAAFPGTEVKAYQGPCGGPENYYKITVYAMPTATTTFTLGNKKGDQIDTEIRKIALVAYDFTVTNYRNSRRAANQQYSCPDTPKECITDKQQTGSDINGEDGLSAGASAAIAIIVIGAVGAAIGGFIFYKRKGHIFGHTFGSGQQSSTGNNYVAFNDPN